MGLRDTIQSKIAKAFDGKLGDAVKPFIGSRTSASGAYDPYTGTYASTTTEYSGRGVFGGYKAIEIDGTQIHQADVKLTVLRNELFLLDEAGEVTTTLAEPAIDDVIDGHAVVNIGSDPASVTWSIQLRKT